MMTAVFGTELLLFLAKLLICTHKYQINCNNFNYTLKNAGLFFLTQMLVSACWVILLGYF